MAHASTVRLFAVILALAVVADARPAEPLSNPAMIHPLHSHETPDPVRLSGEEQSLVEFALERFGVQGLLLPEVEFIFHDSLMPCHGHKGMYHASTHTLEMCTLDKHTMLHELAHAWANENLSQEEMEAFVVARALESWSDHDYEWERRGTEHVAETIAWALLDEPNHVRWVETGDDGSEEITYRILTLGVDVDVLVENFRQVTGMDPLFRHPREWSQEDSPSLASPEMAKASG